MRLFLSWSGTASKAVAIALREWLPGVIQSVDIWMSDQDIAAGARWAEATAGELDQSNFGIVCLTPDNQHAPWIMFESGALSKKVASSHLVPYLLGLDTSEVTGPLIQFQMMKADRDGTKRLVMSINSCDDRPLEEPRINKAFDRAWDDLAGPLAAIARGAARNVPNAERRSEYDMLQEILEILRTRERRLTFPTMGAGIWQAKPESDALKNALREYLVAKGQEHIAPSVPSKFVSSLDALIEQTSPPISPQQAAATDPEPKARDAQRKGPIKKVPPLKMEGKKEK